jgi:hypothetical protein
MYTKSKNRISKINSEIRKWSVSIFFLFCLVFSSPVNAQCAMCRAALTSEGNTTTAAAVNDGIVYLMVIPYILVAGIGYAIYRMKKNKSS